MGQRLQVDSHVIGYWGFDEANWGDPAVGEDLYGGRDLTVVVSPGVVPARIGNGRLFDGTGTYAYLTNAAHNAAFRYFRNGSFIIWIILDSVNQSGDLMRPIVCCDGPTSSANDNTVFACFVDNEGRLLWRWDIGNGQPVYFKTAPGTIRVNRYYSIAVNVETSGGDTLAYPHLYLNNVYYPWSQVTVNGVVQADPTQPVTAANVNPATSTATLVVGKCNKSPSLWKGVVDELSIHDITRPYQPYLIDAYFRLTQAVSYRRISATGTIKTIGSVEMGGGTRWWVYERDQSIYAVRENSLGLFTDETLLTTGGLTGQGALQPGGAEQPRLVYDQVNDVMLVVFAAGGRVFKITANSFDVPVTGNMPVTADTATVIKTRDFNEFSKMTMSEGTQAQDPFSDGSTGGYLVFLPIPTFGVAVFGTYPYGVALYRFIDGHRVLYATSTTLQTVRPYAGSYYWFPIPDRVYGAVYGAVALDKNGRPMQNFGGWPQDHLDRMYITDAGNLHADGQDALSDVMPYTVIGDASAKNTVEGLGFVFRTAIKIPSIDGGTFYGTSVGTHVDRLSEFGFVFRTPVKMPTIGETFQYGFGDWGNYSYTFGGKGYGQ